MTKNNTINMKMNTVPPKNRPQKWCLIDLLNGRLVWARHPLQCKATGGISKRLSTKAVFQNNPCYTDMLEMTESSKVPGLQVCVVLQVYSLNGKSRRRPPKVLCVQRSRSLLKMFSANGSIKKRLGLTTVDLCFELFQNTKAVKGHC